MGARPTAARRSRATITTRPAYRGKEDTMKELWNNFLADESGQGLVEYVLIIALVAIGLIAVMLVFRNSIGGIFDAISDTLDTAPADGYEPGSGSD
jgi:pilus assembly protein Flp/PilA